MDFQICNFLLFPIIKGMVWVFYLLRLMITLAFDFQHEMCISCGISTAKDKTQFGADDCILLSEKQMFYEHLSISSTSWIQPWRSWACHLKQLSNATHMWCTLGANKKLYLMSRWKEIVQLSSKIQSHKAAKSYPEQSCLLLLLVSGYCAS